MLGAARILRRGAAAGASRLLMAGLLFIGVVRLSASDQSDLALALTIVTVLNLVSNFGLPTLVIKYRSSPSQDERAAVPVLVRAYVRLTLITAAGILLTGWLFWGRSMFLPVLAALYVSVSAYSGAEYWTLASGRYDQFLNWGIPVQLGLGLGSPIALVYTHSITSSLAILSLSYAAGTAAILYRCRDTSQPRRSLSAGRHPSLGLGGTRSKVKWSSAALSVSVGTIGATALYSIDIFILRGLGKEGLDAQYRLAVSGVGFIVGLFPLAPLALADASAGLHTGVRIMLPYGAAASVVCLGFAGVTMISGFPLGDTPAILAGLAPLGALRLLAQGASSLLHSGGRHKAVARAYWSAALGWAIASAAAIAIVDNLALFIMGQVMVEAALLAQLIRALKCGRGE